MNVYVAFLRGINVGGKKRIPMVELRQALGNSDFHNLKTYIQSGNLVFESQLKSKGEIAGLINKVIKDIFGFEVPVLVLTAVELVVILTQNPFNTEEQIKNNRAYFVLLFETPTKEVSTLFKELTYQSEKFHFSDSCVYLLCQNGYGKAKLSNKVIENKLKVVATARNYRTMHNLVELTG